MSLRYGAFCLLLCLVVLLLALKNYELWIRPIAGSLEEGEIKKAETKSEGSPILGGQRAPMPIASYIFVADKNIFSPERKEFSVTGPGLDQSKPMTRPQITLYGVTISRDYQSATIVNPGRPLRKGEREMITLTIGDRVGEYKLAKILPDRITMEGGEDSFEVLLFDSTMPKKRTFTKTESKPAEVTSTSPTPAPAPAPVPRAAEAPKPAEPPRERVIEPPLPRPVTPTPAPSPGTYPGRRPMRPYAPPGSEGK
jgi:hypothetical protein